MSDDEQEAPTIENKFSKAARPAVRITLLVSIAGVAVAAGNSAIDILGGIFGEFRDLGECCADYRSYKDEDSSARKYWVPVIEQIKDRIAKHERDGVADVRELQKDVLRLEAKLDLFTAEGSSTRTEFRRRIGRLEDRADRIDSKQ